MPGGCQPEESLDTFQLARAWLVKNVFTVVAGLLVLTSVLLVRRGRTDGLPPVPLSDSKMVLTVSGCGA